MSSGLIRLIGTAIGVAQLKTSMLLSAGRSDSKFTATLCNGHKELKNRIFPAIRRKRVSRPAAPSRAAHTARRPVTQSRSVSGCARRSERAIPWRSLRLSPHNARRCGRSCVCGTPSAARYPLHLLCCVYCTALCAPCASARCVRRACNHALSATTSTKPLSRNRRHTAAAYAHVHRSSHQKALLTMARTDRDCLAPSWKLALAIARAQACVRARLIRDEEAH
eukprot:6210041-Pleurochrysis_carterae.AAC.1